MYLYYILFIYLFYLYIKKFTIIKFFLLIKFLSYTYINKKINPKNYKNTILKNLTNFINTSSSHLTKKILTTFFLHTNNKNKFNITKKKKYKNYNQNYQQI